MSLLARLIAKREGFGGPGKIPTERHNPGDLRHSPHASHAGIAANDIGEIDTDEHGWQDLERQLRLYADRGLTLAEAIGEYAPANENDSQEYLAFICEGLAMPTDTPVTRALEAA